MHVQDGRILNDGDLVSFGDSCDIWKVEAVVDEATGVKAYRLALFVSGSDKCQPS